VKNLCPFLILKVGKKPKKVGKNAKINKKSLKNEQN